MCARTQDYGYGKKDEYKKVSRYGIQLQLRPMHTCKQNVAEPEHSLRRLLVRTCCAPFAYFAMHLLSVHSQSCVCVHACTQDYGNGKKDEYKKVSRCRILKEQ